MKRLIAFIATVLLLVSCANQAPEAKSGSLTLTAPRAALLAADGTPLVMRYSLMQNGNTINLDGKSSVEITGSNTIKIDDLLPGDGYTLSLSIGLKSGPNLEVKYYGTSDKFSISGGTDTSVSLKLSNAPGFVYVTSSGQSASAASFGGVTYILDGQTLKSYTGNPANVQTVRSPAVSGVTVNSLSAGKYLGVDGIIVDELWLNTSNGIYRGEETSPSMSAGFRDVTTGLPVNVLTSWAVGLEGKVFGLYSGGTTVIGMQFATVDEPQKLLTPWQTIADYPDAKDYITDITKDIIRSIGINKDHSFFYVASPVGTAVGSKDSTTVDDLLALKDDSGSKNWVKIPGGEKSIQFVSTAGLLLFAGTDSGLYSDTVTEAGLSTNLTLVPGTAGKKITALNSIMVNGTVVTAAVTKENTVFILKNGGINETLDAATGVPEAAKPEFYIDGGVLHMVLAGKNGAVDYTPAL